MKKLLLSKQRFSLWLIPALFFTVFAFSAILPVNLEARQIFFDGEVKFTQDTQDENYYFAGFDIEIDSNFSKDLILLGGRMDVLGEVIEDTLVFGGEINLTNYTQGDLRIFGGNVNLSSTVEGDLVVIGGNINLTDAAEIRGNTILIGGQITQNSALLNDSDIIAGSVSINNELGGNSEITTQNIIFDSNSNITGDLHYFAPNKATERDGSEISGTVNFNQINTIRETGVVKTTIINVMSFWIILRFITTVILAFILIQLFKVFAQGVNDIAIGSFFKSFIVGMFSLFFVPFIFVILMISLIGLPIGILLVLIYIIIVSISPAISGIVVGNLVSNLKQGKTIKNLPEEVKVQKANQVSFHNAVIGIVLLTVLQFVDWLGDITTIVFNLVAVGAIIRFVIKNVFSRN